MSDITDRQVEAAIYAASDYPGNWIFVPNEERDEARKRMRIALEASEQAAWRPTSEAESGQIVLASYRNELGKRRTVKAVFYKRFWRELDHDCDELEGDYSQELDAYFWPEGWYECIENWDIFSHVTMPTPDRFRPFPKGPSDE